MKLYFLRHGHAEHTSGVDDFDRQLTPEGRARVETAAQVMAALKLKPAHIYSSPRVRAHQTAEIVAAALNHTVETHEGVNFGFDLKAVEQMTEGLSTDDDVMFVGHEPTLSTVIGQITGGAVNMKPGSLARIDLTAQQPPRGILVWLIAPKVFDTLGSAHG